MKMTEEGLEFSERKVGTVTVPLEITEEDIENIIVTAMEGGCNYWMGLDNGGPEFKDCPEEEALSMWCTKLLLEGKTLKLFDVEGDEPESDDPWELTLDKIIAGIQQAIENRPAWSDKDLWDGEAIDCIVQYALFGEITYG